MKDKHSTGASELDEASLLLRAMSASIRLKIIEALLAGERRGPELLAHTGARQPNLSMHLALLHEAGIVSRRRDGRSVRYGLADSCRAQVCRKLFELSGLRAPQGQSAP